MFSSRMTAPVWDSFLYEPLDTATVVSDDIWKKFDLDDLASYQHSSDLMEDPIAAVSSPLPQQSCEVPMMMNFDRLNCQASREIRHHDCMWAGLCISEEHNRAHPAKKDVRVARRVPAGRSLLIPKSQQQQQQQQQQVSLLQHQQHAGGLGQGFAARSSTSAMAASKNLESDGDSTRPETPQSSGESGTESEEDEDEEDEDEEDQGPVFKHEQISINDIVPVSEATGQHIQRRAALYDRRKEEETVIRNTLMSDHCYHLNQHQPISKKLTEYLGVQTPSDSEEEIDVVSWDKPTRAVSTATGLSLPTYPSPAEHQRLQHTVHTAFKERHSNGKLAAPGAAAAQQAAPAVASAAGAKSAAAPAPRPRGRPPSSSTVASRKRAAAAAALEHAKASAIASSNKRAKHSSARTYNRRRLAPGSGANSSRSSPQSSPQSSPSKLNSSRTCSSDDEPDTEKRSLHNNMERQRRIELRNAFEELRVLVPEIEAKEKAPKVAILRQSASYCDKLSDQDHLNLSRIAELRRKQDRLKAQLGYLRRSLAMMR